MKWYQGQIKLSITNKDLNIEKKVIRKFPNINIIGSSSNNFIDGNYSEISNLEYINTQNNELTEKILFFGDAEIFNSTDLIISLYKHIGIDFIKELYGEFSFVLIDIIKKEVILATDHLGIKPLFWTIHREMIVYASDLFLLEEYYDPNKLNKEYFKEYIDNNGQISSKLTPYSDVERVEGGNYIKISYDKWKINTTTYWDLSSIVEKIQYKDEKEYIDEFREILKDSISNRLARKDKNAVLMSGGLDSTSIFALSKSYFDKDIKPISGVFDKLKSCDERYFIEMVLDKYNTDKIYVKCDEFGMLKGYPEDYIRTDEPYIDSLNLELTKNLIMESSRVSRINLIDGYAADHLLSGSLINVLDKIKSCQMSDAFKDIVEISIMENNSVFESINRYIFTPLINKSSFPEFDDSMFERIRKRFSKNMGYNQKQLYIEIFNAKSYHCLDREIAPLYNVTSRHPFLDKELLEYIYKIPGDFRSNRKYNKYILREAIKGFLPEEIIERITKTQHVSLTFKGINENWHKIYKDACDFKLSFLDILGISKHEWIEELMRFRNGQINDGNFMALLSLELWFANHFDGCKSYNH